MPLTFTATGTISTPIPWPVNEGDGSMVSANTVPQPDILRAIQTSVDLAPEVNSIVSVICAASGKGPRAVLFALERTINRMIVRCDDITDARNFTP